MYSIPENRRRNRRREAFPLAALALLTVAATALPALAQDMSPQQLRDACVSSPSNTVQLTSSAKIFSTVSPVTTATSVPVGCTILLHAGATLTFEFAALNFAGPLSIQGLGQTEIKLISSRVQAQAISIGLPAEGSALASSQSNLYAAAGSIAIAFGEEGKLELKDRLLLAGSPLGITAAAGISISGGRKFSGSLDFVSMTAPLGVSLSMAGEESTLGLSRVDLIAAAGSLAIASSGQKGLIEVKGSSFRARDGSSVTALGHESSVTLSQVSMTGPLTGANPTGAVRIQAGGPAAGSGKVEVNSFLVSAAASITIQASVGAQGGSVNVDLGNIGAVGDLRIESGAQGSTSVKNMTLGAGTLLRVASGPGGSCVAEPREIFGNPATIQLCP